MTRSLSTTAMIVVLALATGLAGGCARRTRTSTAPEATGAPSPAAAASPRAAGPSVAAAPTPGVAASPMATPAAPAATPGAVAAPAASPAAAPSPAVVAATPAPTPAPERRSRLETIYFAFDQADIEPQYQRILDANAEWLKRNPTARIQIEGHCDERGSVQYNLALGERRAESARRYLESLGVERGRMSTISYGEERPAVAGSSEDAYARNRRAEFVVTSQ